MPNHNEPPTQAEEFEYERWEEEERLLEENAPSHIKHEPLDPCWDIQNRIIETVFQIRDSDAECSFWDVYAVFLENRIIYNHPCPSREAFICACHCLMADEEPTIYLGGGDKEPMDQNVLLTRWGRELVLGDI